MFLSVYRLRDRFKIPEVFRFYNLKFFIIYNVRSIVRENNYIPPTYFYSIENILLKFWK